MLPFLNFVYVIETVKDLYFKVFELMLLFKFINSIESKPNVIDSTFADKINGKIETQKFKTSKEDAGKMLETELKDVHPEVRKSITDNLKSSNIDRNKYRDLFLIKKRIVNDNDVQITEFDITERIIPKTPTLSSLLANSIYTKLFFIVVLFSLSVLVVTTTIKMYQSIIKLAYIKHLTKTGQSQTIVNSI